jgi:DNA polymerase-3 subunit epsilon
MTRYASDCFAAIDFETADFGRDSACAIGMVRVEGGRIVAKEYRLIRPPRRHFVFTYIHGLVWEDVMHEPRFREVWRDLRGLVKGVGFIAAHNAGFDSSVMRACCRTARLAPPRAPFRCTAALARRVWNIRPATLPDVCRELRIRLSHHHALSDALAAARIVLAAKRTGAV